jgi:N-acetyl-anhydromuramyl-L-alanine amidase AmpD
VSRWKGLDNCNDYSIGIEVVNRGDSVEPFTEEQYSSLRELTGRIASKYGIAKDMVVGHRDIALPPGRKVDPADNFDWSVIAEFADRRRVAELAEIMRDEYMRTHSENSEQ